MRNITYVRTIMSKSGVSNLSVSYKNLLYRLKIEVFANKIKQNKTYLHYYNLLLHLNQTNRLMKNHQEYLQIHPRIVHHVKNCKNWCHNYLQRFWIYTSASIWVSNKESFDIMLRKQTVSGFAISRFNMICTVKWF